MTIVVPRVPPAISLPAIGATYHVLSAVVSSTGMPPNFNTTAAAVEAYTAAQAVPPAALLAQHTAAWGNLTAARLEAEQE